MENKTNTLHINKTLKIVVKKYKNMTSNNSFSDFTYPIQEMYPTAVIQ